jgi:hypothetical protein
VFKPDIDFVLRPAAPAAPRVARRALALCALACRSQLEPHAGDAEARAIHESVVAWLQAAGVVAEFEDAERRIVEAPLGRLSTDDATTAGWRGEAAATLAWGLGRWELPTIDVAVDAADVAMRLDWLGDDPLSLVEGARLRARTDVVQLAEMLEVAQWRLDRELDGEAAVSLRNFDAGTFLWPHDVAPLTFAADGDVAIGGLPLAAAPAHAKLVARRIVVERRQAVNWMAGQHAIYSAVDVGA